MINKNQQVVKLSPENYIRQKARLLPIHECFVNKGWQKSKMCTVIVARKHVNGNVTVGSYLVDLFCLGVKDTAYAFNIPMFEYNDKFIHPDTEYESDFEKIDYTLAHNIIYAGYDFATNIGFKPHSDFLKTTQFLLDEDDDNVELIEVECGYNGQPALIMGDENKKECLKIMAQLDRLVGKGNYKLFDVNSIEDEEPEDEFEEYTPEQFEADKKAFKQGIKKFKKQKPDDLYVMLEVTTRLFFQLVDHNEIQKAYDEIGEALDVEVWYDDIPNEFFGIPSDAIKDKDWVKSTMIEAFKTSKSDENAMRLCSDLKNAYPNMPAVGVLDLYYLMNLDFDSFQELLEQYRPRFSEYKLFEVMKYYSEVSESKIFDEELLKEPLKICDFFSGRTSLFWIEMYHFIKLYSLHTLAQADPVRIGALYNYLNEDYLPEEATVPGKLTALIFMMDYVDESIPSKPSGVLNKLKTSIFQKRN